MQRDWLVYFRGSFRWFDNDPDYSFGIRQALLKVYGKENNFHLLEGKTTRKTYLKELSRSVFCLAPRGFAVWSQRLYEAILYGCIPVIIADEMRLPYDQFLDWTKFSVKVHEQSVLNGALQDILQSYSADDIEEKQRALRDSTAGLFYSANPIAKDAFYLAMMNLRDRRHGLVALAHPSDYQFW